VRKSGGRAKVPTWEKKKVELYPMAENVTYRPLRNQLNMRKRPARGGSAFFWIKGQTKKIDGPSHGRGSKVRPIVVISPTSPDHTRAVKVGRRHDRTGNWSRTQENKNLLRGEEKQRKNLGIQPARRTSAGRLREANRLPKKIREKN